MQLDYCAHTSFLTLAWFNYTSEIRLTRPNKWRTFHFIIVILILIIYALHCR